MDNSMKILIAGFSGAGKSSLVKSLVSAKGPELTYVDDLDELILCSAKKKYMSISQIIESEGWESFRILERQALEAWLKLEGNGVISLGGGAMNESLLNMFHGHKSIRFCYLKVDFEVAWERIMADSSSIRPLSLLGKVKLKEIFEQRRVLFEKISWVLDGEARIEENRDKILKSMSLHSFSR